MFDNNILVIFLINGVWIIYKP